MAEASRPGGGTPVIFISYRHEDAPASAGNLYRFLRDRFGEELVFRDIDRLPGGANWFEFIDQTLGASALVIAVIGPRWLTAAYDDGRRRLDDPEDVLRKELERALERNVRLIPVVVEGGAMPREDELPESLKGLVDRFPHQLTEVAYDADAEELRRMIERIFEAIRGEQQEELARVVRDRSANAEFQAALDAARSIEDVDRRAGILTDIAEAQAEAGEDAVSTLAAARESAESIEDVDQREAALQRIKGIEERFRPAPPPLIECLREAGLPFMEAGEEHALLMLPGKRADQVMAEARQLSDGVAFFSVPLPEVQGFGVKNVMQILLKISYLADYAKAMSLSGGGFSLAVEVPGDALTPLICEGLLRGLAALGDVKTPTDLINARGWNARLDECRNLQDSHIYVDSDQAADVRRLLADAGLGWGSLPGSFELDLGLERRTLSVNVSRRVISLAVPLPGVRPGGDKEKLSRLLDLNRAANVAKVGLDAKGDVNLLYEIPRAVPDLAERLQVQLGLLRAGVRTFVA